MPAPCVLHLNMSARDCVFGQSLAIRQCDAATKSNCCWRKICMFVRLQRRASPRCWNSNGGAASRSCSGKSFSTFEMRWSSLSCLIRSLSETQGPAQQDDSDSEWIRLSRAPPSHPTVGWQREKCWDPFKMSPICVRTYTKQSSHFILSYTKIQNFLYKTTLTFQGTY